MKKIFSVLSALTIVVLLIGGCGKSAKPYEIKGMAKYVDISTKMTVDYPANWYAAQKSVGQRFLVFSTKADIDRFRSYDNDGTPGAKIDIITSPLEQGVTLDSLLKKSMIFAPEIYSKPKSVTIDGAPALMVNYNFDLVDGKFMGELYVAAKDPAMATTIQFEAFGNTFEAYRKNFGEILAAMKLAATPTATADTTFKPGQAAPPPSQTLTQKDGDGFSIMIPDNFKAQRTKSPNTVYSVNYIGERRGDCNIQFDVLDASKQKDLKKIVGQNKSLYKNTEPKPMKIGGVDAFMFSYSFSKDVQSRVYFAVKGTKCFRITMNWFKGEESDYLPVFEKSIASIKLQ